MIRPVILLAEALQSPDGPCKCSVRPLFKKQVNTKQHIHTDAINKFTQQNNRQEEDWLWGASLLNKIFYTALSTHFCKFIQHATKIIIFPTNFSVL